MYQLINTYIQRLRRAPILARITVFVVLFIVLENVLLLVIKSANFYPFNHENKYMSSHSQHKRSFIPSLWHSPTLDLGCDISQTSLPRKDDVTLVSYTTLDPTDIELVKNNIERWTGPISIAIAVDHRILPFNVRMQEAENLALSDECNDLPYETQDIIDSMADLSKFINFQKRSNVQVFIYRTHQDEDSFPVNVIRNIALSQAPTQLITFIQPHQVVSASAYDYLMSNSEIRYRILDEKEIMILPSLIYHSNSAKSIKIKKDAKTIKETSPVLITEYGHLGDWMDRKDDKPYAMPYRSIQNHELAFVMRYGGPVFNENHYGRQCSPATQILELAKQGYRFYVLPEDFVVCIDPSKTHTTNPPSERDCRRVG
eukprot:gb/GECH01012745.1/.p1 GENE.gb/GECH01012745.1/~~gb/GECH01012745.1/.p1  ORF type:complete len:372 (+),score=55.87 gb/GECH01012745.1/:1-1116(+)